MRSYASLESKLKFIKSRFKTEEVSPARLLALVTASVILADVIIHFIFLNRFGTPLILYSFSSTIITISLAFPFLYLFFYRPMINQIRKREEAEEALSESHAYYRAIVEDQTELICRCMPDGRLVFVNQAFCRFFKRDVENLEGSFFWDFFSAEEWKQVRAELENLTSVAPVVGCKFLVSAANGKSRWLQWTLRALFDDLQRIQSFQAVAHDITDLHDAMQALQSAHDKLELRVNERTNELAQANEDLRGEVASRQKTEEILLEREARLQMLLSQFPAVLWSTDQELNITSLQGIDLEPFSQNLKGYFGKNIARVLTPTEHEKSLEAHQKALSGKDSFFTVQSNGKYLQNAVSPLRNNRGDIIGCIGIAMDVTDHHLAQEKIHVQAAALEAAANGIIITGEDGVIQWANPAFFNMTGYSAEEVVGKSTSVLRSDQHPPAFFQELWETILNGKVWNGELINRRKDGSTYTEEQTITPVTDASGRLTHFIAIKQDITRRKEVQEKIRRRNYELSALNTISNKVNSTLELSEIFEILSNLLARELSITGGAIFYTDNEGEPSRLKTIWGISERFAQDLSDRFFAQYQASEQRQQRSLVVNFSEDGPLPVENLPDMARWSNCLFSPLCCQNTMQGVILLLGDSPDCFSSDQVQLFEALNAQVGIAVQNARLLEQVEAGRARLQALSRRLVDVQEKERRHVARELHDEASQALTYLVFAIEMLKRDARKPKAILAGLKELEAVIQDVLDNLRRIAVDLRPASLDLLGLIPALNQYADFIREKHGLEVIFETRGLTERLPTDLETALYRIVQESVVNVVRHANANRVEILLEKNEENKIIASIRDNGIGFDPLILTQSSRLGIFGMRERAEMLGGTLHVTSSNGTGTSIFVEVPGGDPGFNS